MFEEIANSIPAEFYDIDFWFAYVSSDSTLLVAGLLCVCGGFVVFKSVGGHGKVKSWSEGSADNRHAQFPQTVSEIGSRRVFYGLSKTRSFFSVKLRGIWSDRKELQEFWTELGDSLIASDMGVQTSENLIAKLREFSGNVELPSRRQAAEIFESEIVAMLGTDVAPLECEIRGDIPYVIVVVGVNGSGKTTTIGKLAKQLSDNGLKVMLAACDTFRAAAREQLEEWARRSGAVLECGAENEKPATVAFRALEKVKVGGVDVLLIDTAGRLHTRVNLMHELESVLSLVSRVLPGAPHQTLLVLDGTSGQNALHQARVFKDKASVTGIVVTKLDGTAKGGIVVGIREELKIPIRYIGIGEGVEDLRPFKAAEFARALLDGFDSEI